jgi:tripartite-type tricarboxylate transporter receptor subunit TctC
MTASIERSSSVTILEMKLSRRVAIGALSAMALAVPAKTLRSAPNTAWPNRSVRLVTGAAAGSGSDAVARTVADALSRRWRQPVIVDNRPGGEGIVSIQTFLAGHHDQHTLLFNPSSVWTVLHLIHEHLTFDAVRDLVPVSFVVRDFIALAASPQLGAATLSDVVALAKAAPGRLTWACAPGAPFLAFTEFLRSAGLELTYVPYRNPTASLPDLAEGRVDLAFLPLSSLNGPAQSGRLRVVAIASEDRAPLMPNVPTARESNFPALLLVGGLCLFGPREMPLTLRAQIVADVGEILALPDIASQLSAMGYIPGALSPPEFVAFLERERARWTKVAQAYGAKPTR